MARTGRVVLWCCFLWYLFIMSQYFLPDASLWINSVIITVVIGSVLNINALQVGRPNKWAVFRFYLIPFCVSSYSAIAAAQGFRYLLPAQWW